MKIRDLNCWPPEWRGDPGASANVPDGEDGTLTGVRWDLEDRSLTVTMEYEGDRHSAVLRDDVGLLTKVYLMLGWHVGRPLAKVGTLEITP